MEPALPEPQVPGSVPGCLGAMEKDQTLPRSPAKGRADVDTGPLILARDGCCEGWRRVRSPGLAGAGREPQRRDVV